MNSNARAPQKHPKDVPRSLEAAAPVPEDIINSRLDALEQRRTVTAFLTKLLCTLLAAWVVFTFAFGVAPMSGEGMYPRIRDGDVMFFYRLEKPYHIGDVVTFIKDGERYTGRIVAMGGDSVDMTQSGELLINGNVQSEEIFYPTEKGGADIAFPYAVEADSVFLLCDLRTGCTDSRNYGAVPIGWLDGKVITILRRRGI